VLASLCSNDPLEGHLLVLRAQDNARDLRRAFRVSRGGSEQTHNLRVEMSVFRERIEDQVMRATDTESSKDRMSRERQTKRERERRPEEMSSAGVEENIFDAMKELTSPTRDFTLTTVFADKGSINLSGGGEGGA
jgi:hypothetical protein